MTPSTLEPWPLDYSWCTRQGPWTTQSDVLLECLAVTQIDLSALMDEYLAPLKPDQQIMQDTTTVSGYWNGGVFLYVTAPEDPSACASPAHRARIWLHSRGEDALDSLAWVSRSICEALKQSGQCQGLSWVEHPHTRGYRVRTGI